MGRILRTSVSVVGRRDGTRLSVIGRDLGRMERTIFCVQPYHETVLGLQPGHMRRLLSREAALRAARGLRGSAAGVVVYSVTGSAEADYWREPRLLARAGAVPREASRTMIHSALPWGAVAA